MGAARRPGAAAPTLPSLPGFRELGLTAAAFLLLTAVFLWFAVSPLEFASHVQTRDALLMAVIQAHTTQAIFGGADLWNLPIFHPLPDMLCLSEPMLLPALLLAPFQYLFGYAFVANLYLYLCWTLNGLAGWLYLRHRGLSGLASFWGGFLVAFSPAMLWHAAGHAHLYFQAGFPLALLAFERGVAGTRPAIWGACFGLACLLQALAGFYLTAFFAMWLLLTLPLIGAGMVWKRRGRLARLPRLAAGAALPLLLAAVVVLPMVRHYSEFGKSFPSYSLEMVAAQAADLGGYLLPPTDPQRLLTPTGRVASLFTGQVQRGEATRYVGLATILLMAAGAAMVVRAVRRRRGIPWRRVSWMAAFLLAGLVGLVLSLGPYIETASGSRIHLPHAYLYAWLEQVRFIRATPRFAILTMWAVAILGAAVLQRLLDGAAHRRGPTYALGLGISVLLLTMVDFFPTTRIFRTPVERTPLAEFLASGEAPVPMIELPVDSNDFMVRLGWHLGPVANGYSGYYPHNRRQQLLLVESYFPEPRAMAQLSEWGIREVFLARGFPRRQRAEAMAFPGVEQVWEGEEGTLLRLPETIPSVRDLREELRANIGVTGQTATLPLYRGTSVLREAQRPGFGVFNRGLREVKDGVFISETSAAYLLVELGLAGLDAALMDRLTLRVRVDNWYPLNENLNLYWSGGPEPAFNERQRLTLLLKPGTEAVTYEFPLRDHPHWLASGQLYFLRLDFGNRVGTRIELEDLRLEFVLPLDLSRPAQATEDEASH